MWMQRWGNDNNSGYGLPGLLREETASAIVAGLTSLPLVNVYDQIIRLALHKAGSFSLCSNFSHGWMLFCFERALIEHDDGEREF